MQLDRCFAKHGATRPKHRKHGATRPKHGATRPKHGATRPKHRKHDATRPKHWKASKRTLRVGWESPSILALRALWGSSGQNRVTRYRSTCYSNTLHRRINDFVPDTTLMRWGHVWGCGTMQDANNWCDNTDDPCVFVRVRKWGNVRVCVCVRKWGNAHDGDGQYDPRGKTLWCGVVVDAHCGGTMRSVTRITFKNRTCILLVQPCNDIHTSKIVVPWGFKNLHRV